MGTSPNSYEALITARQAELKRRAPFLFGHGASYTVEGTYFDHCRVRVGPETRVVLFEGAKLLGFPNRKTVRERATRVLEGRAKPSALLSESLQGVDALPDHVVLTRALEALARPPYPMLSARPSVLRSALSEEDARGVEAPAEARFGYLLLGTLTESAVEASRDYVVRATHALLDKAEYQYNRAAHGVLKGAVDSPVLRGAVAQLPEALAEIVRTGRPLQETGVTVPSLVQYHHGLAARLHLYELLGRTLEAPSGRTP